MVMARRKKSPFLAHYSFLMGCGLLGLAYAGTELYKNHSSPFFSKQWSVCFTPSQTCQQQILDHIQKAQHSLKIQAYSFTDKQIMDKLIKARRSGVKVEVLLDKSNKKDKQGQLRLLKKNNIPVRIDAPSGIAHNKIIIIDDQILITGSYNFSISAYKRNAENVLIIQDPHLIAAYLTNWNRRWSASSTF
jgi:phospholipase D